MRTFVWGAMFCLLGAGIARAEVGSSSFSVGYSNIAVGPHSKLFFERSGAYVDGDVLWRIHNVGFPLLVGGAISGSGYDTDQHVFVNFTDGSSGRIHLFSDLGTFALEARAAAPIALGSRGFFIMPKISTGLLIDSYSIDTLSPYGNNLSYIDTKNHIGAAFELRPAIQAGYSWGWGSAGAEVSYMLSWGDFGRLGSSAQEFRAGLFARFKF